jgi:hypothetical protein
MKMYSQTSDTGFADSRTYGLDSSLNALKQLSQFTCCMLFVCEFLSLTVHVTEGNSSPCTFSAPE